MRWERSAISPDTIGSKPMFHPSRFPKREMAARKLSANRLSLDIGVPSDRREMGGAKRYPSIAICGDDGFREGLNPSELLTEDKDFGDLVFRRKCQASC